MRHRRIATVLILLLCTMAILSGALLILHADHACHETVCPICIALTHSIEMLLCAAAILTYLGLLGSTSLRLCSGSPENRFVPDWTPVRQKVKLLD